MFIICFRCWQVHLDCAGTTVNNLRVRYFDTIPVANALCISKNGLLFAASEFSNQYVDVECVAAM